ncbi:unnamed protein product [Sphagnum balticum]
MDAPKRRRIIIEDDEDEANPDDKTDDVNSNPDKSEDGSEEEEEGEDLAENWLADYVAAPELDVYDPNMLDDNVIQESYEDQMKYRRAADEELDAEEERRRLFEEEAEDNLEDKQVGACANHRFPTGRQVAGSSSSGSEPPRQSPRNAPIKSAHIEAQECPFAQLSVRVVKVVDHSRSIPNGVNMEITRRLLYKILQAPFHQDRTSIHEAMEQQNDICVESRLQDTVDPIVDEQLATFVVNSHHRSHPDNHDFNQLEEDDEEEEDVAENAHEGSENIEASARMHLRDYVREDDIDLAIKVMLESFLQAQKVSVRKMLQKSFRKYITFGEETNQLIMHQLQGLVLREEKYQKIKYGRLNPTIEVAKDELEAKAKELNVFDLKPFYNSCLFKKLGFHADYRHDVIVKKY